MLKSMSPHIEVQLRVTVGFGGGLTSLGCMHPGLALVVTGRR
jgi:hypothetical protein